MKPGTPLPNAPLWAHTTDGGAEYLCSEPVPGTCEGSFRADLIIRLDGIPCVVRNARANAYPRLVEALEGLFAQCVMIHRYGGDGCNQREADAAINAARALLTELEG
jgi:hypothetical protein